MSKYPNAATVIHKPYVFIEAEYEQSLLHGTRDNFIERKNVRLRVISVHSGIARIKSDRSFWSRKHVARYG